MKLASQDLERQQVEALVKSQVINRMAALAGRCRWVRVYYLWRPNLPDEADNHVVELAVAGGAEAIVTHNTRDFTRAELRFPGLRVLNPGQLITED